MIKEIGVSKEKVERILDEVYGRDWFNEKVLEHIIKSYEIDLKLRRMELRAFDREHGKALSDSLKTKRVEFQRRVGVARVKLIWPLILRDDLVVREYFREVVSDSKKKNR